METAHQTKGLEAAPKLLPAGCDTAEAAHTGALASAHTKARFVAMANVNSPQSFRDANAAQTVGLARAVALVRAIAGSDWRFRSDPFGNTLGHHRHLRHDNSFVCSGQRNRFVVMRLELANLFALLEICRHRFARQRTHLTESKGRPDKILHRRRERLEIAFLDQQAAAAFLDCFRHSTVLCREDWESRRHRFEDRIWNSFLVLVRRRFAGVEKTMRAAVKIEQFPLRKKTAEMDFAHNPEFFGELFEMRLKRSLSRDDQLRVRKFFLENGKRAQRSRDALFWNQPARLHETPAAVGGRIAPDERKFVERNAGAIDSQTFRRTT